MLIMKVAFILAMCLAALLSASGCSDKLTSFRPGRKAATGADARSGAPKRSGRAGSDVGDEGFPDVVELGPEASMRQGLAKLAEKEREQESQVRELRQVLSQGTQQMRQEEERLLALREQRQRYEEALAVYEPPQTAAAMAAMPAPRQQTRTRNLALENGAANGPLAEGERMIYNPMANKELPRSGGLAMKDPEMAAAPAPMAERRTPQQQSRAAMMDDEIQWNPPKSTRIPTVAEIPTTGETIVSRPEPRPQVQSRPAQTRNPERAPAPTPAVAAVRTMTPTEDDAAMPSSRPGGVFVPDLVLGGA